MLSVTMKLFMLCVIMLIVVMLSITSNLCMLSVTMLIVIMLSVVMLNVVAVPLCP